MRRRVKVRHHEEPEVNLTPLIDIVFVILIVFIVIAPLLQIEQVQLADASSTNEAATVSRSRGRRRASHAVEPRTRSRRQWKGSSASIRSKFRRRITRDSSTVQA